MSISTFGAVFPRLLFFWMPVQGEQEGKDKSQGASQGAIKNNRLEVFEDKRYAYDTHGNLVEKKIGKHTRIQLTWDVEHQLQSATRTRAAHTGKPVTTETKYRYDAFGRRLEKRDPFASTLFEWDGNRLLSERRGSKHTLYIYEADSFAPLAQVELEPESFKGKPAQIQAGARSMIDHA
jgi:YD repeat-containing protein